MSDTVIDETGKIWDYNVLSQNWRCINASGFPYYPSVVDLEKKHGPVYQIERGSRVIGAYGPQTRVVVDVERDQTLYADVISHVVHDDGSVSYALRLNISGSKVTQKDTP